MSTPNDLNLNIVNQFNKVYNLANEEAEKASALFLSTLHLEIALENEQIVILRNALKSVQSEIQAFEKPEYIYNHNNKEYLLKVFTNRLVFFEIDEQKIITEAFTIDLKLAKLQNQYNSITEKLHPFIFQEFKEGKENIFFYKFNERPPNTSFIEYFKCRNWQSVHLINVIETEKCFMQNLFRSANKSNGQLKKAIAKEKEALNNLFNSNLQILDNQFITLLRNISIFNDATFVINEPNHWKETFFQVCKGVYDYTKFTPQYLKAIQNAYISCVSAYPISEPPIIFLSLIKYDDWIDELSKGSIILAGDINYNCDGLFIASHNSAIIEAKEKVNAFKVKYNLNNTEPNEYKKILLKEFLLLRDRLNELDEPLYFQLLDYTDDLEPYFIQKCYFRGNHGVEIRKLETAVKLYEEINFYSTELSKLFEGQYFKPSEGQVLTAHLEVLSLLNSMTIDSKLYKQAYNIIQHFLSDIAANYKPFFFLIQDLKERLIELFEVISNRLINDLDYLPTERKSYYINVRLKEIKQNENAIRIHGLDLGFFASLFRDLLNTELDFVKEVRNYSFDPLKAILENKAPEIQSFSFGYNLNNIQSLEKIYLELNRHVDFLDCDRTTKDDFIAVFNSSNLAKVNSKIYINCETAQFRYILDKMNLWFTDLSFAKIERSKLFYTKNNTLLTANNLSRSKINNPKQQETIDSIFSNAK
jgi:hypothetical protein